MHHKTHHTRNRGAMLAMAAGLALSLTACAGQPPDWDIAGALQENGLPSIPAFDHKPPPITVRNDGPSGVLLNGPGPAEVTDNIVDAAVGESLRPWLTPFERRELAQASQYAAAAVTGTPVPWQAADAGGVPTAGGAIIPVNEVFRSVRGKICRNLEQSVQKGEKSHHQKVTLCRDDRGNDTVVWVLGQAER